MTLGEILRRSADFLADKGVDSPRVDAEQLLAHALGLTRIQLYTELDRPLREEELAQVRELLRRRGAREPLAYVLGEWGFRRLTLRTDARALVPRPETEVVVERCLALVADLEAPRVLDVGRRLGRDRALDRRRASGREGHGRRRLARTRSRSRARTRSGSG